MKFMVEVYEAEIGKVAALLGRPVQVIPVVREKLPPRSLNGKRKPALQLLTNEGPTTNLLAFAVEQQRPFSATQAREHLGDAINKNTFYSTIKRLVQQNVLAQIKQEGQHRRYHLTEVGRRLAQDSNKGD